MLEFYQKELLPVESFEEYCDVAGWLIHNEKCCGICTKTLGSDQSCKTGIRSGKGSFLGINKDLSAFENVSRWMIVLCSEIH